MESLKYFIFGITKLGILMIICPAAKHLSERPLCRENL